jgi:predicted nucleic acid-binding protein
MREVFADAVYWVALFHPAENLHDEAVEASKRLGKTRIVTSEMVLCEVLNILGKRGEKIRQQTAAMVERLRGDPNVLVVPQTSDLFSKALHLFRDRPDKQWSLTDCSSFVIMGERGISEALTKDKHFHQAKFVELLGENQE